MIKIVSAGAEQADMISELAVATFYETYAAFNTASDMLLYTQQHYTAAQIIEELKQPDVQYFLAFADDKPATSEASVKCSGANACKGHSACKTATNACKGQNACKGKGFTETTAKDCAAKGGKEMK